MYGIDIDINRPYSVDCRCQQWHINADTMQGETCFSTQHNKDKGSVTKYRTCGACEGREMGVRVKRSALTAAPSLTEDSLCTDHLQTRPRRAAGRRRWLGGHRGGASASGQARRGMCTLLCGTQRPWMASALQSVGLGQECYRKKKKNKPIGDHALPQRGFGLSTLRGAERGGGNAQQHGTQASARVDVEIDVPAQT
jgi:hypothetical protein